MDATIDAVSAPYPSEERSSGPRPQLNVRLRRSDHELLAELSAATGLPAAQVIRLLLRQGARRLVIEERARREEEESWRRQLQREATRWRPPPPR